METRSLWKKWYNCFITIIDIYQQAFDIPIKNPLFAYSRIFIRDILKFLYIDLVRPVSIQLLRNLETEFEGVANCFKFSKYFCAIVFDGKSLFDKTIVKIFWIRIVCSYFLITLRCKLFFLLNFNMIKINLEQFKVFLL